jgi:hypothetical protein
MTVTIAWLNNGSLDRSSPPERDPKSLKMVARLNFQPRRDVISIESTWRKKKAARGGFRVGLVMVGTTDACEALQ